MKLDKPTRSASAAAPIGGAAELFTIAASPDIDVDSLLEAVLELALRSTGSDTGGAIVLEHPDRETLHYRVRALAGTPKHDEEALISGWRSQGAQRCGNGKARGERPGGDGATVDGSSWFVESRSAARIPLTHDDKDVGMIQVEASADAFAAGGLRQLEAVSRVGEIVLQRALLRQQAAGQGFDLHLVGMSPALLDFERRLKIVAKASRSSVLITGERGCGKELAAYAIHYYSPRRDKPFVPLNSAALSETLFSDELFGHERGAYTGASQVRKGALAVADGGTLFLDEIGDMTPQIQAALLRFLETGELRRVGSDQRLKLDVRIVAATNRDLDQLIGEGAFRADVLDRLNVFHLQVPPLRDRTEDIPLLSSYFMKSYCHETSRPERVEDPSLCDSCRHTADAACICSTFYQRLTEHQFPGNVRELRNVMARLAVLVSDDEIEGSHARAHLGAGARFGGKPAGVAEAASDLSLAAAIRRHIEDVLEREGNNKSAAARVLGVPLTTLINKMKRLGMMD